MSPEYNVSCKFVNEETDTEIKVDFNMEAFSTQENQDCIDFLYKFVEVFKQL